MTKNRSELPLPEIGRIEADLNALSQYIDPAYGGWTRLSFTDVYEDGRKWIEGRMREAGLSVHRDEAANIVGRIEGSETGLPPILVGSHSDTVRGGGRFDGTVGVLAGIEIARLLNGGGINLRYPLEVIDFTAEEPTDFGISTVGSKALAGNLTEQMLALNDPSGRSLSDALAEAGGDPSRLPPAARRREDIRVFLELHIEQGPVLEEKGMIIGAVEGIVGIDRYLVSVGGRADHAGTTPMSGRRDALAGAAEILLLLEEICRRRKDADLVGTIGRISVEPNAANVVAAAADLNAELRALNPEVLAGAAEDFLRRGRKPAEDRGLEFSFRRLSHTDPVAVPSELFTLIREACEETSDKTMSLVSGAGHDANQMAHIAPAGMIFVQSRGGRSHCPQEYSDIHHIAKGVEALFRAVYKIDGD